MSASNINRWVFKFAVLTTLIAFTGAQVQDPYDQLSNYFFTKCTNNTKQTQIFDKLYADSVEFKRYLKYTFKFIPEEQKLFCEKERGILENKMKEVTRDLAPCLGSKEKFLEDFLLESFKEALHFLCHNDGEHIKTFFSSRASECRNKIFNTEDPNLPRCFARIFKPASGELQKKEICDDLAVVKKCFAESLEFQCPSYGSYKKLNEDFFNYVRQPCAGCAFYLNSLLLSVSLLVSYIFSRK